VQSKCNKSIKDKVLAAYLALKSPTSARFWRLKALETLNAAERGEREVGVSVWNAWATTGALTNGNVAKR
jgi:hypothetical protein